MSVALATSKRRTSTPSRTLGAGAFVRAAPAYWLSVHPQVRAEIARLRRRAAAIPDPQLRRVALTVLTSKRTNLDGAAAFAAFVPPARRPSVVRAQLCFQAIYDYLDLLTEQRHCQVEASSRELHEALLAALIPAAAGAPSHREGDRAQPPLRNDDAVQLQIEDGGPRIEDGGYLRELVARCGAAVAELPSYQAVREPAQRLARRIVDYQSLNDSGRPASRTALQRWASAATPASAQVAWWETAASAGSSLGLFALLALAATPGASAAQAQAIEVAYFPWIGALHSLLDSLIDRDEDIATGQHPLIEHYGDPPEVAAGLRRLTVESYARAQALPNAGRHVAILAAMAAIYLAEGQAAEPRALAARAEVLAALGGLTTPAMAVMRVRRRLALHN